MFAKDGETGVSLSIMHPCFTKDIVGLKICVFITTMIHTLLGNFANNFLCLRFKVMFRDQALSFQVELDEEKFVSVHFSV